MYGRIRPLRGVIVSVLWNSSIGIAHWIFLLITTWKCTLLYKLQPASEMEGIDQVEYVSLYGAQETYQYSLLLGRSASNCWGFLYRQSTLLQEAFIDDNREMTLERRLAWSDFIHRVSVEWCEGCRLDKNVISMRHFHHERCRICSRTTRKAKSDGWGRSYNRLHFLLIPTPRFLQTFNS